MHFSFFGSGRCAGPIGRTIFLKSISANKLFKRYLINIFCVVSLTIALIVVIVFSLYSNMQISASKAYSIGQLEQVCEMTNLLYEQMRSVFWYFSSRDMVFSASNRVSRSCSS